ncbi:hypothetical protein [Pedobacter paludis]|uniref:Uncharacterized protein n=1 Tax=Pedobacter paludis TaxID=2203212 RepID=A0A317F1G9_9SPHI|nr:hypothetical protein [Pedobacter paludis]PWS33080.1 hypothetical protein DF947_00085 [Pedobacter paludis]
MKKYLLLFITLISYSFGFAQEKLIKDIDLDGIKDTVYIDVKGFIVCQLSTQKFKKIKSKVIEIMNDNSRISGTKNGFEFRNNWMRAGYANQFRYNKALKKVQLIGMSRYEFGNAANDGSGESSVNLLNGDYLGNWNYFSVAKNKLIKIPTIKAKMVFAKIYLEDFGEETYFNFSDRCTKLYEQGKAKTQKVKG